MGDAPSVAGLMQATKSNTEATITNYNDIFDETDGEKIDERKAHYMQVVNQYYDLVTDFYEYGWGESFHFAPRYNGEAFLASAARCVRLRGSPGPRSPVSTTTSTRSSVARRRTRRWASTGATTRRPTL